MIITNGTLFNKRVIDFFKEFPLNTIQFTFDGVNERHNTLRCFKLNGKPTFDIIASNIVEVSKSLPDTELHIRVNVDKENFDDYYIIKNYMNTLISSKKVIVYPGFIRKDDEKCSKLVEPSFQRWEIANLHFELFNNGLISDTVYPQMNRAKTCCASSVNSFIVGPEGEIYKCWNDVSDKNKVIGNICSNEITNPKLYYRYHEGCAWYNDPECRKSFFMPICHGKCAWYNHRNLYENGEYNLCQCMQKAPGLLDKCLEQYYRSIDK